MQYSNWSDSGTTTKPTATAVVNNFLTSMKNHPITEVAVTAAPPSAVTGLHLAGVPLSDVVLILNVFYVILSIAYLIYKIVKKDTKDGS
jgi:uncharacterized membrane protein